MKTNCSWVLAVLLVTGFSAQQVLSDVPPPAGSTPKAAQKKKASAEKKKSPAAAPAAPGAPQTAVVKQDRVNVRGQAAQTSEVITQLRKGESVTILQEITLAKTKSGESAHWAKILLPGNTPVWVNAAFVDAEKKTVTSAKLNVRAGPGENFSVIGQLARGDAVKEIRKVEGWIEIEPPPNTYAFVAADLLEKSGTLASVTPAPPAPEPAKPEAFVPPPLAPEPAKPEPAPATPPPAPAAPAVTENPAPPPAPEPSPAPAPATKAPFKIYMSPRLMSQLPPPPAVAPPAAAPKEPLPKRVVRREGIVRVTVSIQAPTLYALENAETGALLDYLYSPNATIKFKDLYGLRIVVTGEEYIDDRWPKTPVIKVETLQVVQ